MQKFTAFAFLAASIIATGVNATPTRGAALTSRQIFELIDTDRSGFIDVSEAKAWLTTNGAPESHIQGLIDEIWAGDLNKDGVISFEEWSAQQGLNRSAPPGSVRRNNIARNSPRSTSLVGTASAFHTLAMEGEDEHGSFLLLDSSFDSNLCPEDAGEGECLHKAYFNEETQEFEICLREIGTDEAICFDLAIVSHLDELDEDDEEADEADDEETEEADDETEEVSEDKSEDSSEDVSEETQEDEEESVEVCDEEVCEDDSESNSN